MLIVFLRHADKVLYGDEADSPLSPRGEAQAQRLVELVRSRALPRPSQLISSPRSRTRATLLPLSEDCQVALEVRRELDQRWNFETQKEFSARVSGLLAELADGPDEVIYLCSHADWLAEALSMTIEDAAELGLTHFSCAQARLVSREQAGPKYKLEGEVQA